MGTDTSKFSTDMLNFSSWVNEYLLDPTGWYVKPKPKRKPRNLEARLDDIMDKFFEKSENRNGI